MNPKDLEALIESTRETLNIAEAIVKLPPEKWEERVNQLPYDRRDPMRRMLTLLKRECQ